MVKRLFHCCSLEVGNLTIGWLCFIITLFGLAIQLVVHLDLIDDEHENEGSIHVLHRILFDYPEVMTVLFGCLVLSTGLMIYSIRVKKRWLLIPWLIVLGVCSSFLTGTCSMILLFDNFVWQMSELGHLILIISALCIGCFLVYIWYGVYSLFQNMNEEGRVIERVMERRVELVIEDGVAEGVNIA